jgi:hypothetical protein
METGRTSEGEASPGAGFSGSDKGEILANPEACVLADPPGKSQAKEQEIRPYFTRFINSLARVFESPAAIATMRAKGGKSG